MKKVITLILAVLLILGVAGCGRKTEMPAVSETTVPVEKETDAADAGETTVPAPTEPEWKKGIVRAGWAEAVYRELEAAEKVKVLGSVGSYLVVEGEDVDLLVEERFLRTEGEEAFEPWEAYARAETKVYDNVYQRGEPIATLQQNTKLKILEGKSDWMYISWDDGKGYIDASKVSQWFISGYTGGTSSGNAGAVSDGSDVPVGSLTSAFTDDEGVHLTLLGSYYGPDFEKTVGGTASVIAENVEAYLCVLDRGDEVKVTDSDEKTVTIYLGNDCYATLPGWIVTLEEDEKYTSWTGYSKWDGVIYGQYQMRTEQTKLTTNIQVSVLDEIPGGYIVQYGEIVGYMDSDKLMDHPITSTPAGNGGGNSQSGSTWTPPAL